MLRSTTHALGASTAIVTIWDDDNRTSWTFALVDGERSSTIKVSYDDPNADPDKPTQTKSVVFHHP